MQEEQGAERASADPTRSTKPPQLAEPADFITTQHGRPSVTFPRICTSRARRYRPKTSMVKGRFESGRGLKNACK
jgi:hypothetical protein